MHVRRGFTLVELLVVVGTIAILIAILLPALSATRRAAQRIRCGANLRQIAVSIRLYAAEWRDVLHNPTQGTRPSDWLATTSPYKLLPSMTATNAINGGPGYWGIPYFNYLTSRGVLNAQPTDPTDNVIIAAAAQTFLCPSQKYSDKYRSNTPAWPTSYGINRFIVGDFVRWRKLASFRKPSETIFCHDSFRPVITVSAAADPAYAAFALSSFNAPQTPGKNLQYYRPGNIGKDMLYPTFDPIREFYRHNNQCQVLWLDGHVNLIRQSDGDDVPASWYWGQPAQPIMP